MAREAAGLAFGQVGQFGQQTTKVLGTAADQPIGYARVVRSAGTAGPATQLPQILGSGAP